MDAPPSFPMARDVPRMGVIRVVHEASKLGFWNGHPDWCNLGRDQPDVGDMPGAPEPINHIDIAPADHAYGPVGGTGEVREALADMVNRTCRRGRSKYTADNVSFASGGRLALSRLYTILADGARIAYKNPDYTAYEDYLYSLHNRCVLRPSAPRKKMPSPFRETLENFIVQEKANVFVFSTPCNPTGELISGDTLESYVATARREHCLLGSDEFYSHFIYNEDGSPASGPVAEFVEDADTDPVVLSDGLTKSHRYPG